MSDAVVANMVAGYARVDRLVADGVDLFAMGSLKHLLELNTIVLCGCDQDGRAAYAGHLRSTEQRFYEEREGGIRDVVEWYARHRRASAWHRAAGVYVRILSRPQLFIEGNHRTGALAMSYILMRDGLPPFVLTTENAPAYFDPSTVIRTTRKQSLGSLFRLSGIKRRLAVVLARHANPAYLITGNGAASPRDTPAERQPG